MSVTIESEPTTNFADYRPSGELCQLPSMQANVMAAAFGEMSICSKLGPNLWEMEFRIFVRIQKVIWDHLLASKAEISQK